MQAGWFQPEVAAGGSRLRADWNSRRRRSRVAGRRELARSSAWRCIARWHWVALIAKTAFAFGLARPIVPTPGPLFHQLLKLLALSGCQEGVNLVPRFQQLFARLRLEAGAQFAHALLAIGHDLVDPLALFGREAQLTGENLNKFPVKEGGARRGGIRRAWVVGQSRIVRW